jgi:NADH:ubiquinone oxidoreductase subunit 6 (subunit J)
MSDRDRPAREIDFDTAELAQLGAVVLIMVSVMMIVLGQQRVIAEWLALGSGAPVAVVAVVLFWKTCVWQTDAKQRMRDRRAATSEQEAGDADAE